MIFWEIIGDIDFEIAEKIADMVVDGNNFYFLRDTVLYLRTRPPGAYLLPCVAHNVANTLKRGYTSGYIDNIPEVTQELVVGGYANRTNGGLYRRYAYHSSYATEILICSSSIELITADYYSTYSVTGFFYNPVFSTSYNGRTLQFLITEIVDMDTACN